MSDMTRIPKTLFVVSTTSPDGIVHDVVMCSVPPALAPEVAYIRADEFSALRAEVERLKAEIIGRQAHDRMQVLEIVRLRAENERLRAALKDIARVTRGWEPGVWTEEESRKYFASLFFKAQKTARAALSGADAPQETSE